MTIVSKARSLANKPREVVSVLDWDGADPTGVADSYTQLLAAINSLLARCRTHGLIST
jgi:hypothetical protein